MNRTIKLLIFSDIFLGIGFGLFEPILAIFIKENLIGGTIVAAGIASTVYLVTKSILQVPFARYIDRTDNRVQWLITGGAVVCCVPFLYIFATHIWMVYVIQVIHGIGNALVYPTWLGLWSTHLDKHKESFEWSVYSTTVSLGAAVTASAGAVIAELIGFQAVFTIVGIMSVVSWLVLFRLRAKNGKPLSSHTIVHHHQRQKRVAIIPK